MVSWKTSGEFTTRILRRQPNGYYNGGLNQFQQWQNFGWDLASTNRVGPTNGNPWGMRNPAKTLARRCCRSVLEATRAKRFFHEQSRLKPLVASVVPRSAPPPPPGVGSRATSGHSANFHRCFVGALDPVPPSASTQPAVLAGDRVKIFNAMRIFGSVEPNWISRLRLLAGADIASR